MKLIMNCEAMQVRINFTGWPSCRDFIILKPVLEHWWDVDHRLRPAVWTCVPSVGPPRARIDGKYICDKSSSRRSGARSEDQRENINHQWPSYPYIIHIILSAETMTTKASIDPKTPISNRCHQQITDSLISSHPQQLLIPQQFCRGRGGSGVSASWRHSKETKHRESIEE